MAQSTSHRIHSTHARRVLLILGIAHGAAGVGVLADTQSIRVGVAPIPSSAFQDQEYGPREFFREIGGELASRVGVQLEWAPAAWPDRLRGLSDGSIDMLGLIALTEQRRSQFTFSSEPLFVDWGRVYTRRDADIGQVLDLDGKTVAVPRDDVYFVAEHGLRQVLGEFGIRCEFVEYDSYDDVAQAIANGAADAGLLSRLFGGRRGDDFGLEGTPILVNPRSIHWAFRKDLDPEIVAAFDSELRNLKATPNSVYYRAAERWLPSQQEIQTPGWVHPLLLASAALLILMAVTAVASHIRLRRRTRELAQRNAELQASDERLRLVTENMPVMMVAVDENVIFTAWNRECERNTGYSADEIIGNPNALELLCPEADYRERILRGRDDHGGDYRDWEWELTCKNGEVRRIAWSNVSAHIPIPGWASWGVGVDVTERAAVQSALQESESRLRSLVESAEDCIFIKGRDTRYTQVNPAMERLLGRPAAEILGRTDMELFGPGAKFIREVDQQVLSGEIVDVEDQVSTHGVTRTFQVIKVPLFDESGEATSLLGIARDITERKRAEGEVCRRGSILASLSEAAQLLIATDRWEKHIPQMLSSLGESTGAGGVALFRLDWDVDDAPQPLEIGCWTDHQARERCGAECCSAAVAEHRGVKEWLASLQNSDAAEPLPSPIPPGKCGPVKRQSASCPLLLPVYRGATLWGCLSLHRCRAAAPWSDLEIDALRTAAGLIGAAIKRDLDADSTLQLESQLRQAQKMDAVGQLAGGVAHDFNNILTTILGNVELSLDAMQGELPVDDPLIDGLQQVGHAANRAAALTRQLLVFSRRDVTKLDDLNLNETVTQLESMLRRLIKENIHLEVNCSPATPTICADVGQIEQVIVNLVVNGVDAMKRGGSLTLETGVETVLADQAVAYPGVRPGRFATLSVRDTGVGMNRTVRERAFEPFYTTKPVGEGAGLGLSIIHGIVKKSGGFIAIESSPDQGSVFTAYLPECEPKARAINSASTEALAPSGAETVLLCEDDEAVRGLTVRILRNAGYSVMTASHGREALALAKESENPVDLLITDVVMPEMSGKELADLLADHQPNLNTLFMSGYTSSLFENAGVAEQDVDLLHKPFNRSTLLTRVRAALDRRGASAAHATQ